MAGVPGRTGQVTQFYLEPIARSVIVPEKIVDTFYFTSRFSLEGRYPKYEL
jgi:hypothetical protein